MTSPPGYPEAYILEITEIRCSGCSRLQRTSRLMTVVESRDTHGRHSERIRPSGAGEVIFDCQTTSRTSHIGTARCEACIDQLPRIPVPRLPEISDEIIGHYIPPASAALTIEELAVES